MGMAEGEEGGAQCCMENKQSAAASGSSVSEGSCSISFKSPGGGSPPASPSHRRTTGPIRRAKGGWTPEEDETLRNAVATYNGKSWKKIAEFFPDRSEVQCLHRWQKVLNPDLIKGPWTQEEDEKIVQLVAKYGPTKWSVIAKSLPGRIGKQCRERWHNHLNPDIKKDAWTLEEELVLMNAHRVHGNKWAEIARVLPGRTDNSIKNHWNSSLKKKLDFYLATGKLPPVAKSNFQLGGARDESKPSTDSSKLPPSSNKESDSSAQTSSGTTDNCKPDESKNQLESSDPIQLTGFLSDNSLNKSADLHHLPQTDVSPINGNVDDTNVVATPLKPQLPTRGSLFYKTLQQESCSPLASTYHLRPEDASPAAASPAGFFTPPCVKINSPESILRFAASTFPNTPSIMRKRKATPQSLNLSRNIDKSDADSVKDRCSSSIIDERTQDRMSISGCQDDGSSESLASRGHRTLEFYSRKSFNASPPYRLRSKRTGVFKSVEKQLDFTADSEKSECDAKPANHPLQGHFPAKEEDSSHATRKGVT